MAIVAVDLFEFSRRTTKVFPGRRILHGKSSQTRRPHIPEMEMY